MTAKPQTVLFTLDYDSNSQNVGNEGSLFPNAMKAKVTLRRIIVNPLHCVPIGWRTIMVGWSLGYLRRSFGKSHFFR